MKIVYECEYCGQQFYDKQTCINHEKLCVNFRTGNMCDYCDHAYYVYGCEFDCKYRNDCNILNRYKNFKRRELT